MTNASNVVQLPVAHANSQSSPQRGWSYLIAESVAFKKDVDYGIRIQKPEEEQVPSWISKLITSGKCGSIYVENLKLDATDKSYLKSLCDLHNVSLFNLAVVPHKQHKILQGPW